MSLGQRNPSSHARGALLSFVVVVVVVVVKTQRKKERAEEHKANVAAGNPGDVDFIGMVRHWRTAHASDVADFQPAFSGPSRLCVCVRKRPLSDKERDRCDHDAITCLNPNVWIHAAKTKVDGITKYLYVTVTRKWW